MEGKEAKGRQKRKIIRKGNRKGIRKISQ